MALSVYVGSTDFHFLQYIIVPVQSFLSWMTVRWIAAKSKFDMDSGFPSPLTAAR